MPREFFCAYHSYLETMEALTDAEKGRLFTSCLIYSKTGEVPQLSGNERFVFPAFKGQIDRDTSKFEAKCKKNRENADKRWNGDAYERMPQNTKHTKEKEKEKEKEKRNKENICTEPSQAPAPEAVVTLLLNDKSFYSVTQDNVQHWQELFPAVDIVQELRKMSAWCEANAGKRKTRRGIERFITSWLSRTQDKGGTPGYVPSVPKPDSARIPAELPPGKTWAEVYGDHPAEIGPGISWEDLVE